MRFFCVTPVFFTGFLALVMVSCDRKTEEKSDEVAFKITERDPRKIGQPREPFADVPPLPKDPDTLAEKYPEVASVVGIVKGVFSESADHVPPEKPSVPVAPVVSEIKQPASTPATNNDLLDTILKNAPAIVESFLKQRSDGEVGSGELDALGPEILDAILKNGKEISREDLDAAQEAIVKYGPVIEDLLKKSTEATNGNGSGDGVTASSIMETIFRQLIAPGPKAPQPPKSQSSY